MKLHSALHRVLRRRVLKPGFLIAVLAIFMVAAAAGPHWNPSGQNHPNHEGDFPTLLVMENGKGRTGCSSVGRCK